MLNCRINQNIRKDCDTHVGGIYDTIYLYDIDDVESLSFTNDTRYDSGASVATINSRQPFFTWQVSDGEYEEDNDGDEYTHTLTANIHKTENIENILSDAKNTNFLVVFRLKSEGTYRMFGWELGAKLTYTLTAGEDGNYYTITFEDEGTYPSFETDASNFNLRDKVFQPNFVPDFNISVCENLSGKLTGYRIASYVVKVNAAGEPLDENDKLCEYSGKKQVAYKLEGVSDAHYQVIGTYKSDAMYNGQAVKVYDAAHCSSQGTGTITVSPNPITLTAHGRTSVPMTITTTDTWSVTDNTPFADVSKYSGKGNSSVNVTWNGLKSNDVGTLIVRNENTNETVAVITRFLGVWVDAPEVVDYSVGGVLTYINTSGGSAKSTVDVQCSDPNVSYMIQTQRDGSIVVVFDKEKVSVNGCTFTIKATHNDEASEYDTAIVKVRGDETAPDWKVVSSYCELVDNKRTGYKITRSRDQNPKSSTYGDIIEDKKWDDECAAAGEVWVKIGEYCETDAQMQNTGYKITVEQQITEGYPSTGTTRSVKTEDRITCPYKSTEPNWVTISQWCLTDEYGQNGQKEMVQRDENVLSPSFHSTRNIQEEDLVECPPNTAPVWNVVTSECLQNEGGNTGYEKITYIDVNPRSERKGETRTETILNEENCPYGTSPVWVEIGRVCKLDEDGDNTGYVEITQENQNTHSETYGETRTVTEYNTTECALPSTDPRWEVISWECEVVDEFRTGYVVGVKQDMNKKSATYGQTESYRELDETKCSKDAPQWEVQSEICETDAYGQTGNKVTRYIDVNPNSKTYQHTRNETVYDATTCKPNTDPYWVTESTECESEE